MGKVYLYIVLLFVFTVISGATYAQRIHGAVIGGFNLSQVDGDNAIGFYKLGVNTGLAALLPVGKNFYFTIETVFNQKGSYQSPWFKAEDSLGNELNGRYHLKMNYLEVPVLLLYNDKDIITAGAGFSYGRLVSIKEYEHGRLVETTSLNTGPYDRNDFNILADVRFRIHKRFKFNFRYSYSLLKIRTRDFYDIYGVYEGPRDQYNNVLSFRLIYMFNEKPPMADTENNDPGF